MSPVSDIVSDLARLGVGRGDCLMVHASLRAIGPIPGGPRGLVEALRQAVGPAGTLVGYASWAQSPYELTLNGATMSDRDRASWPAFDPATAKAYPGFGYLNELLRTTPGALRSAHPDASIVALGSKAAFIVNPHPFGSAFGPGSPMERLVEVGGRVLLLGAPLDAVTVLHYAEAIAAIQNKRRVTYEMPVFDSRGRKVWVRTEEFDSNGILDRFADGEMDAVEHIARSYVASGHGREGTVAGAHSFLFEAYDVVRYGVKWLEDRFGTEEHKAD